MGGGKMDGWMDGYRDTGMGKERESVWSPDSGQGTEGEIKSHHVPFSKNETC